MNPKHPNPENFEVTLYPRKCESEKTSRVNAFREEFKEICTIVGFLNSLQYILTTNTLKSSQNIISRVKIMLRIP